MNIQTEVRKWKEAIVALKLAEKRPTTSGFALAEKQERVDRAFSTLIHNFSDDEVRAEIHRLTIPGGLVSLKDW